MGRINYLRLGVNSRLLRVAASGGAPEFSAALAESRALHDRFSRLAEERNALRPAALAEGPKAFQACAARDAIWQQRYAVFEMHLTVVGLLFQMVEGHTVAPGVHKADRRFSAAPG